MSVMNGTSLIDHFRSRGIFREIGDEHRAWARQGAGLYFCPDADQAHDKLTHLFGSVTTRIQPWVVNGGGLALDPQNPSNIQSREHHTWARQYERAHVHKRLTALFLESHDGCLIQEDLGLSLAGSIRSLIRAAAFLTFRFPATHVVPLFTVRRPDGLRTYVVSKSRFETLPGVP